MTKAVTKASESIRKPYDVKVNILPIFGSLIHKVAYEGPCRFGGPEELTEDFDTRATAMGFKAFKEKLEKRFGGDDDVNMLEPMLLSSTDEFFYSREKIDELDAAVAQCDVIFVYGNPMNQLMREMSGRYAKPIMLLTNSGAITLSTTADYINRGRKQLYGCIDWDEVVRRAHYFKVLKALANTRVLKLIRHESEWYLTDDFKCGIDEPRFGVTAQSVNMHEVMDQLHPGDGTGNYTLPLRTMYNLTEEEEQEAERITDELMGEAVENWMERDKVLKSVRFNVLTRKLMEHFQCNAFTGQCKECCATTRINEEQITYCLGHTLNNEIGIASACEGDMNALVALTVLSCLTHKAPYQSNTTPVVMEDGEIVSKNWFSDQPCISEYPNQLYCTWHATPTRYMDGFDEEPVEYAVGPFAATARFGATIRRDFAKDAGKTITLLRFNPAGTKMLCIKGEVVGGTGYERFGCPEGIYFKLNDRDGLFKIQQEFGCHTASVFGDYSAELKELAEMMGCEFILCE